MAFEAIEVAEYLIVSDTVYFALDEWGAFVFGEFRNRESYALKSDDVELSVSNEFRISKKPMVSVRFLKSSVNENVTWKAYVVCGHCLHGMKDEMLKRRIR